MTQQYRRLSTGSPTGTRVAWISVTILAISVHLGALGLQPSVKMDGASVRKIAVHKPSPVYPEDAAKRLVTGPVVVAVTFSDKGDVESAEVLQAPDPALGAATLTAVKAWKIPALLPPPGQKAAPRMSTKLTFYFSIRNGKATVLAPEEAAAGDEPPASPTAVRPPRPITLQELSSLRQSGATVVDLRNRRSVAAAKVRDAVNIPKDELASRAPAELSRDKPIVLDCTTIDAGTCRSAAAILTELRFTNLYLLTSDRQH